MLEPNLSLGSELIHVAICSTPQPLSPEAPVDIPTSFEQSLDIASKTSGVAVPSLK